MRALPDAPPTGAALFHGRSGGFPLLLCTYVLLDADSNATDDLPGVAVVSVTALNGERFRLRDPGDIRRFLTAVGRSPNVVAS
ncbi:MAG: hypothetical protein HGA65_01650 [Oscillochloris sp.]|nr:hypothetical protein [Oscillochloris sp.]